MAKEGAHNMTTTKKPRRICDSCYDSITEEFQGEDDFYAEDITLFAASLGADIPDHYCEKTDDPTVLCKCACFLLRL